MTTEIKYQPVKIPLETVSIDEDIKYFSDILELNPIPSNVIIDKTLTGLEQPIPKLRLNVIVSSSCQMFPPLEVNTGNTTKSMAQSLYLKKSQ